MRGSYARRIVGMPSDVVNWELAIATGSRLAPKGPVMSLAQARSIVHELRTLSDQAVAPVRECTGLISPSNAPGAEVVDRATWIRSNVDAFQFVLEPILDRVRQAAGTGGVAEVGSRVTAIQLGAVLAWLSGKVLGQYEAISALGKAPQLLLVAPNIVKVADTLAVDRRDFAMWVCLHEETHRVQFTATPWLSDYLAAQVRSLLVGVDVPVSELIRRSRTIFVAVIQVLRGKCESTEVIKALQTPAQRVIFDQLTAFMSLLEGHADVVMDQVGPEIVPSVELIRERFDARRANPGAMDSLTRRMLGMDAKMRQYSDGAKFVRAVMDQVGMDGFNRVWESQSTLPSLEEIAHPGGWVSRVHG